MISLEKYREYWEGLAAITPEITGVLPVTVDDEMAKKITALRPGSVTLFVLPPAGESMARNADSYAEDNECVVFVMEKYDTQRRTAWSVLESSQIAIESLKAAILDTMGRGCPLMRLDVSSLTTLPETKFFAGFAGWSLGFKLKT